MKKTAIMTLFTMGLASASLFFASCQPQQGQSSNAKCGASKSAQQCQAKTCSSCSSNCSSCQSCGSSQ